jgi:SH3-like domain-containing protein
MAVVVSVAAGTLRTFVRAGYRLVLGLCIATVPILTSAAQEAAAPGGQSLPRFVSLKAPRVNMRKGPGEDYAVSWIYLRAGLPVEVVQEFENWRRIRDAEGTEGWVFQGLLTGKRTAVVTPWEKGDPLPIRSSPDESARITAFLQPGVLAAVSQCKSGWCRLTDPRFVGWIEQDRLWGVYPNETVE